MRTLLKPTHGVLALLCLMYFITYIDRVNFATAAIDIQPEFGLNNTELGFVFSAFNYSYFFFQVIGGWIGDRFGPRKTLFACGAVWAVATILTGSVGGIISLIFLRVLLGLGEGATFPTATLAMQNWVERGKRGFAQGLTHSFARLGNAITPPVVAFLMIALTWRGSFVVLGCVSLIWVLAWVWYFRDNPKDHPDITAEELSALPAPEAGQRPKIPWRPLAKRIWPVTLTYFCYGWCLAIYLSWLPLFFKKSYDLDLKHSAIFSFGVFLAGVIGDSVGGIASDHVLRRTGNVRLARLSVILVGFVGALLSLVPLLLTRDLTIVGLCLSAGFFFFELIIGPIWSIPMDIAPKYSGTAAGMMNSGSALAAAVSLPISGYLIDLTGSRVLPFTMLIGILGIGAVAAFAMHPEIPFSEPGSGTAKDKQASARERSHAAPAR
ncbi:MAG: MFS transporter [Hyphomicrobiales bacterium]|nr:MFS transporter [Hyphomicrobiales bacterium]